MSDRSGREPAWSGSAQHSTVGVRAVVGRLPWGAQLGVVLAVVAFVARLPGLVHAGLFDGDEAAIAVMGKVMADGGHLYVDVIDRKPPIVPAVYAAVFSLGGDMRVVRLLCAFGVVANGVVVALLVRRLSSGSATSRRVSNAAIAAGALSVLGTALFLPADAQAANFELWGLFPASTAILCAVVARQSPRSDWKWFALAGVCAAVATNCKQPYVAVLLPVGIEALRSGARRRNVAALVAGVAVATVPMGLFVDLGGLVRWGWLNNGDYLDGGISTGRAVLVGLALSGAFLGFHLPMMYGLWAGVTRRVRLDPIVVFWTLASLVAVSIGFRFFGHYYQQLAPPLAVLCGVALVNAPRAAWRLVGVAAVIPTAALVGMSLASRPAVSDLNGLGQYVKGVTAASDRIVVWGARPDVYFEADRMPSGVFVHDGYLTGAWASRAEPLSPSLADREPYRSRWALFLADIQAHPPTLIIDATSASLDWGAYPPSAYPIGTVLSQCYRPDTPIDGLPVWRRDWVACPS